MKQKIGRVEPTRAWPDPPPMVADCVPEDQRHKRLHLSVGCGKLHEKTTDEIYWVNIDRAPLANPDLVLDMTKGLPFALGSVDHIRAMACLGQIERNDDFMFVMNEFHRVLRLEGTIWIYLPHKDKPHCWLDPFNQRRTNEMHWLGFDQNSPQYIDHLGYYGFQPWKKVTAETNEQGFISVNMTKAL